MNFLKVFLPIPCYLIVLKNRLCGPTCPYMFGMSGFLSLHTFPPLAGRKEGRKDMSSCGGWLEELS